MRLELSWRTSASVDRWLEYIVDGFPLSHRFIGSGLSFISPLGWGTTASDERAARRLLGDEAPDIDGRTVVYVDSAIGDPCDGAVTVVIRREAHEVAWEDFAFSSAELTSDGSATWRHEPMRWPPLWFSAAEYRAVIENRPRRPLPDPRTPPRPDVRWRRWWQALRRRR